MSFDPLKAVHIHAHGARTIGAEMIGVAEEENLLIHACGFSASRQKIRETTPEGELVFRADFDPTLTWNVRATVLAFAGLADAHPGPLSRQALLFANGYRYPHQFRSEAEGEAVGILFYEDPSTEHDGGDTPEISFTVALEFSDLDTTNHAGEETLGVGWTITVPGYTPETPVPDAWTEMPAQSAASLTAAGMAAILSDAFAGGYSFGAAALTLRLYDGDPAGAGTPISDPLTLTAWADLAEITATSSRLRNDAAVEWPAKPDARTCTHLQWARNGIAVARKTLAAPLVVPAFSGVRAPIGALAIALTWQTTGDTFARMATLALRHLRGDATGLISAETTVTVKCYDEDPEGTGILLDEFTVPRDAATWTVAVPAEASNDIALTGTDTAPFGGWLTNYITVEVAGVADLLYANFLSGDIGTLAGDPIEIPIGTLAQNLA